MTPAEEIATLRAHVAALANSLRQAIAALEMDAGGHSQAFWRAVWAPLEAVEDGTAPLSLAALRAVADASRAYSDHPSEETAAAVLRAQDTLDAVRGRS